MTVIRADELAERRARREREAGPSGGAEPQGALASVVSLLALSEDELLGRLREYRRRRQACLDAGVFRAGEWSDATDGYDLALYQLARRRGFDVPSFDLPEDGAAWLSDDARALLEEWLSRHGVDVNAEPGA